MDGCGQFGYSRLPHLRRERQLEDIAKVEAAGVYKGRPASIDVRKVRQMGDDPKVLTLLFSVLSSTCYHPCHA
jgi:hypothetical protein